ncbi:hypothetical protein [Halorussus caseinilyticus]|uniref:Uncharacterized protein n=1 Tax=Halorussus caseinilyticus TaxID=3034025 RepID=A0ABD5WT09_9EURY|nr:hypothetical protein [Halorussus sp. DT72]
MPSPFEVVFFGLFAVAALLKWRLLDRLLSGEFSPWNLLGEYRDGKQSAGDDE